MQRSNLSEWKNGKMLELISMEMVFQRCLELRILCLEPGNEMRSFVCSYEDVVVVLQKRDEERQGRRHTTGLWKTVLANGVLPLGEFLLGSGYAPRVCYAWQDEKETRVHWFPLSTELALHTCATIHICISKHRLIGSEPFVSCTAPISETLLIIKNDLNSSRWIM
ncbi:hypothetical protein AAC387_Pa08g0106 [Persea americana]